EKLRAVFCVVPLSRMKLVILLHAFLKGDVRGSSQGFLRCLFGALIPAGIEWIDPVLQQLPCLACALAGLVQREVIDRSQAHRPLTSAALIAQQPRAGTGWGNLKVEAPAVAVAAWLSEFGDLPRGQCHRNSPLPRTPDPRSDSRLGYAGVYRPIS